MQLMILSNAMDLKVPANVNSVTVGLIDVVTFDPFPTADWTFALVDIPETGTYTGNFANIGYTSTFFLMNMGTVGWLLHLQFVQYLAMMIFFCLFVKFKWG